MSLLRRRGFTLIEILVVVAIIAIVLSIVIPNLFRMISNSKRVVCIDNLRKIESAVEQLAIDNKIHAGTNLSQQQEDEVYHSYLRSGKPKCPSGGEYVINPVEAVPQVQCTREDEGHKL